MKLELKAFKMHAGLSNETTAFTANLWMDGRLVAECENDGRGGPNAVHWLGKDAKENEKRFSAHVKSLHHEENGKAQQALTEDFFISNLVEEAAAKQWRYNQAKRKVLFRLQGDEEDAYRTYAIKTKEERVQAYDQILGKHEAEVIEIVGAPERGTHWLREEMEVDPTEEPDPEAPQVPQEPTQEDAAPEEPQEAPTPQEAPAEPQQGSRKMRIFQAWRRHQEAHAEDYEANKEISAEDLIEAAEVEVKESSVKSWLSTWRKGRGFPKR